MDIYPQQKEIDRAYAIQAERRKIYVEFLLSFNAHFSELNSGIVDESLNDTFYAMQYAKEVVRIYGSSEVVACIKKLQDAAFEFHKSVKNWHHLREADYDEWELKISASLNKVKRLRFEMVFLMRNEVHLIDSEGPEVLQTE